MCARCSHTYGGCVRVGPIEEGRTAGEEMEEKEMWVGAGVDAVVVWWQ